MHGTLLSRSMAVIPIAMSAAALALLVGYLAMFGVARQTDEGTAAHLWQGLMAGQIPIIALFAVTRLPVEPRRALPVLALQIGALLTAAFPVWWFQW